MKQRVYLNLVEEGAHEVSNHEILYIKNDKTGAIDLQKRDAKGNMVSIVQNSSVLANPELGLTPVVAGDEFDSAYNTLLDAATAAGASVDLATYQHYIDVVREYLPAQEESMSKGTNKVNIAGYKTDKGFVVSDAQSILECSDFDDTHCTLTVIEL